MFSIIEVIRRRFRRRRPEITWAQIAETYQGRRDRPLIDDMHRLRDVYSRDLVLELPDVADGCPEPLCERAAGHEGVHRRRLPDGPFAGGWTYGCTMSWPSESSGTLIQSSAEARARALEWYGKNWSKIRRLEADQ